MDAPFIIITGCSSGIGRALALGLQGEYRVLATVRNSSDAQTLNRQGIQTLILDLSNSASIQSAVVEMKAYCGGNLHALINNGAYGQAGAVEDLSRDTLRRQFETNLFGTQELTNAVIPMMRVAGGGRIIQISSVLGFVCLRYRGAYNASKYALEALSDTMRLELKGTGIKIIMIEPGPISSLFRRNALKQFRQNIRIDQSYHQLQYQQVLARLNSKVEAAFTLPSTAVLKPVRHALISTKPKTRYRLTFPTHLFYILKKILPDRTLDAILRKV